MRKLITIVLVCFLGISGFAQIVTIQEKADNGKTRTVEMSGPKIVDINSSLEVDVNKREVLKAIELQYPQLKTQVELESKIDALQKALENQESIINILQSSMPSRDQQQTFFFQIDRFLMLVGQNSELRAQVNALYAEYDNVYGITGSQDLPAEAYIIQNLNNDLDKLVEDLNTSKPQAYSVSLLAFKKDPSGGDRVHVKNFDTYTERDYVTIDRWVTTLSEEQKKKLEDLRAKAEELNKSNATLFDELKQLFKANFPNLDCIGEVKDNLNDMLQDPQLAGPFTTDLKNISSKIYKDLGSLQVLIDLFNKNFDSWDVDTVFQAADALKNLKQEFESISISFDSFKRTAASIATLQTKADTLVTSFTGCYSALKDDYDNLTKALSLIVKRQSNFIKNKEIGKEVLKFTATTLPQKGFINLKGTGNRSNGDQLLIEVVLRFPASEDGMPEQIITLEEHLLTMQLIGIRSEVAVGMLLMNPNESSLDFEPERKFYFAPGASLLFKFGSRKSMTYNNIVDFGLGINFASPDLDTDGTPEFGVGIIATAIRDIISVGYGYNVTIDAPYWYFGVNLPFNFPGIPVNNVKTTPTN
ncbi:hypothetical protein J1N09_12395 [Aureitalea sp. L0-47]|uniref:hypothetical protein n=1 Tax=Aureitalea sp. L0-47 TaxID=2816962 RepID=UPI0022385B0F|nr:hypothetical protein [Aureitalea sp. L0-47]MCW5520645.1 hypothetical protein [Aureitalea sp. L0-47]